MSKLAELLRSEGRDAAKISSATGIAPDRINALAADAEPTVSELRRIAVAFKVPITDFAAPVSEVERQADLLLRRAPVAGKSVPAAAIDNLSRRISGSLNLIEADHRSIPWWWGHFEHGDDTEASAMRNAVIFRRLFCGDDQLSPLLSLPRVVADRMSVLLFVVRNSHLDGASAFFDGVPFIFVSARFQARMLFTLAHECGHLVAHHDPTDSFAVIDEVTDADPAGVQGQSAKEQYANAFASELLMPRTSVGLTLKKVRELANLKHPEIGDLEIGYLARIFGVSFWAAARRCEGLGLIPSGGAFSLNERLAKEFGSAEKRAEAAGLPPRPKIVFPPVPASLLSSAVERIRQGHISVGRAASTLGLSIDAIMGANAPTAH